VVQLIFVWIAHDFCQWRKNIFRRRTFNGANFPAKDSCVDARRPEEARAIMRCTARWTNLERPA
jgi:hypothetical protein